MDDKRIYLDGVYAVRKGRKKGGVLRLCIHPCNVAVSCSVCGSPCKLGATGEDGRWTRSTSEHVTGLAGWAPITAQLP